MEVFRQIFNNFQSVEIRFELMNTQCGFLRKQFSCTRDHKF